MAQHRPTFNSPSPAAKQAPQVAAAPVAETPAPYLGAPVLVMTSEKIGGQNEHAAMITRVVTDDLVNVMMFPGEGQPYSIPSIRHSKNVAAGSLSWRWPPRN